MLYQFWVPQNWLAPPYGGKPIAVVQKHHRRQTNQITADAHPLQQAVSVAYALLIHNG